MATFVRRPGPRGKPVWQALIRRRGYPQQTRTFNSKARAEEWALDVEGEMSRGDWKDRTEGDRTTLRQALERYEQEVVPGRAPSGKVTAQHRIHRLQAQPIADLPLSRIGGLEVADYIRSMQENGLGANSVRLDLAVISHLYTVARSAWGMGYLVNPVPLAKTARPRLPAGRDRRLKDGEEEKLLAAAESAFAPVIRWALSTAMRRSEISGLTWDRVDLKRRSAHLPVTKNGSSRTVPLSREAIAVLESIPRRLDGSVFGLTVDAISLFWRRAIKSAHIEGLTFHDLRHEAISRLFENTDLDAMEIARISGHQTLSMLSRYTHLRAHKLADRLDGVPRGAVRPAGEK